MASDMLSQEEIDALLKQSGMEESSAKDYSLYIEDYLTALEQDALGEIGNITFGNSSTALSTLLSQKVDITTPLLSVVKKEELSQEFPQPHVAVYVNYTEGFQGTNLLVIKVDDAKVIADLMLGGDGKVPAEDLNDIHISAVQEAMNQMMGSAATSMSTIFDKRIDISPPGIDLFDFKKEGNSIDITADILIKISFNMKIGDLIDSNIMQIVPVGFAKEMVSKLINPEGQPLEAEQAVASLEANSIAAENNVSPAQAAFNPGQQDALRQGGSETNYVDNKQNAAYQQESPNAQSYAGQHYTQQAAHNSGQITSNRAANVQSVQFSKFEPQDVQQLDTKNLNLLLDVPIQVTVELGRTKRVIKDILDLSPGSILELDKLAGEPVDILVNSKLIAKGEVVVIEENFGVRVTDIVSQWDRLQKL